MSAIPEILAGFLDGLRPVSRLSVSEWAEKHRMLSSVSSAEPGQWRNSRTPYLVEIMDRIGPYDDAQDIIVMKGSQVGVTEAAFNAIGFYIAQDPCSIIYAMPTESTVQRNSRIRFDPMVEASDALRRKIAPMRSRDRQNSVLQKTFPGGVLVFCGTNSPAPLRSIPARIVVLDEVDAMPSDVDGEGSPVKLAKARARTFSSKKIIQISTPTSEGASMIKDAYERTSQKKYFVPCPHCGEMQTLEWERMRWKEGLPATAAYQCAGCEEEIQERYKPVMLAHGRWRDTKPTLASSKVVGYHLSSLYSPLGWLSWEEIVRDYEESAGKETERKVWVNTVLGETYKEESEAPDWQALYDRRENYPNYSPPKDVVVITAGVDVQKDRLEVEVVGWCRGMESYSIDYFVLVGETSDTSPTGVWGQLGGLLTKTWRREDGTEMPISRMCVDSGYNTAEVYAFCARHLPTQVVPVKGSDSQSVVLTPPRAVDRTQNGKKVGTTALWSVGVSILKNETYGWLKLKKNEDGTYPPGYCHFPTSYDAHYFRMLTAEALVKRIVRGFPRYEWVKEYARNEALDCRVYARAATYMIGMQRWNDKDWDAKERSYHEAPPPKPRQRRESFLGGGRDFGLGGGGKSFWE